MHRYFNDVWQFDLEELRWTPLGPKPGQSAPAPRGGCQLALDGHKLYVFGECDGALCLTDLCRGRSGAQPKRIHSTRQVVTA